MSEKIEPHYCDKDCEYIECSILFREAREEITSLRQQLAQEKARVEADLFTIEDPRPCYCEYSSTETDNGTHRFLVNLCIWCAHKKAQAQLEAVGRERDRDRRRLAREEGMRGALIAKLSAAEAALSIRESQIDTFKAEQKKLMDAMVEEHRKVCEQKLAAESALAESRKSDALSRSVISAQERKLTEKNEVAAKAVEGMKGARARAEAAEQANAKNEAEWKKAHETMRDAWQNAREACIRAEQANAGLRDEFQRLVAVAKFHCKAIRDNAATPEPDIISELSGLEQQIEDAEKALTPAPTAQEKP